MIIPKILSIFRSKTPVRTIPAPDIPIETVPDIMLASAKRFFAHINTETDNLFYRGKQGHANLGSRETGELHTYYPDYPYLDVFEGENHLRFALPKGEVLMLKNPLNLPSDVFMRDMHGVVKRLVIPLESQARGWASS